MSEIVAPSDNSWGGLEDECDDICDTNKTEEESESNRVEEEEDEGEAMNDIPEDAVDNENNITSEKRDDENNNTIPGSLPSETGRADMKGSFNFSKHYCISQEFY